MPGGAYLGRQPTPGWTVWTGPQFTRIHSKPQVSYVLRLTRLLACRPVRLFCAPEAAGQGIASRLYDAVEASAREQGITNLFTEASELARRLFERKGFAVVERQDLVVRGVDIHNYRMAKALD